MSLLITEEGGPKVASRVRRANKHVDKIEWLKMKSPKVAKKLNKRLKDSQVMKDVVRSMMRNSIDPERDLAEEFLFSGSIEDFESIMDANVSVTSYVRNLEKVLRIKGDNPYNDIVKARNKMAKKHLPEDAKSYFILSKKLKKKKKSKPKETQLSSHTLLTEHRRRVMFKAMLDDGDCEG